MVPELDLYCTDFEARAVSLLQRAVRHPEFDISVEHDAVASLRFHLSTHPPREVATRRVGARKTSATFKGSASMRPGANAGINLYSAPIQRSSKPAGFNEARRESPGSGETGSDDIVLRGQLQ